MLTGTFIRLKGVTFNNPALPKLIDYKEVIANHAACVGAWRFDREDLLVMDGTGISEIKNWRDGGASISYTSGSMATVVNDTQLGHNVAQFGSSGVYTFAGTFDPREAFTIVAICKPDAYSVSQQNIAGAFDGTPATSADLRALTSAGSDPIIRFVRGGNQIAYTVPDSSKYVAVYGSHVGSSDMKPSIEALGDSPAKSTGTSEEVITDTRPFLLSHGSLPFIGKLDFVALFSDDLIYQQADLKGHVDDYLRLRLGL